jgi:hypothetical protein
MATTADTTKTTTTTLPKKLLVSYLKERVSADADAPHRGLPFITEAGVLRIRPADWMDWLAAQGIEPSKKEAVQALKDAGLVQKVYALPKVDGHDDLAGKSFGLYTGPAPAGTAKLQRRAQRA